MSRQISALDAFTSPTYPFVPTPSSPHPFINISFCLPPIASLAHLFRSLVLSFFFTATVFSFLLSSPLYPKRETSCHLRWLHQRSFNFFRVTSILSTLPSFRQPFLPSRSRSLRISSLSFVIRAKRFGFSVSFSLSPRRCFLHPPEQTPRSTLPPANICSHLSAYWSCRGRPQQPTKSGASSPSRIGCSIEEAGALRTGAKLS